MYTLAKLHEARTWAQRENPDTTVQAFALAKWVIQDILGNEWFEKNLGNDSKGPFFRMNLELDGEGPLNLDADRTISRAVALGENLFNQQNVGGFCGVVRKFKTANSTETTYCELEVGALLRMWSYRFRFLEEIGTRGCDFDIHLNLVDDLLVPVETKCKLDSTSLSLETLDSTLKTARKQLPSDGKGLIFLKVPQAWIQGAGGADSSAQELIQTACEAFLKGTGRVASIKLYSFTVEEESDGVKTGFKLHQIDNKRLDCLGSWSLFDQKSLQSMNPQWTRFFEFVD